MAQFNTFPYNTKRYNSDVKTSILADTVSLADELIKAPSISFQESQFLQDNDAAKQPAKGFSEEVIINAWLMRKRDPAQSGWSDQ